MQRSQSVCRLNLFSQIVTGEQQIRDEEGWDTRDRQDGLFPCAKLITLVYQLTRGGDSFICLIL